MEISWPDNNGPATRRRAANDYLRPPPWARSEPANSANNDISACILFRSIEHAEHELSDHPFYLMMMHYCYSNLKAASPAGRLTWLLGVPIKQRERRRGGKCSIIIIISSSWMISIWANKNAFANGLPWIRRKRRAPGDISTLPVPVFQRRLWRRLGGA